MRLTVLLSFLLLSTLSRAQYTVLDSTTGALENPNQYVDKYHDLLRFHDPIMYLAFPYIKSATGRSIPLTEGEGSNGFLLEGNFAYRFVVHQGKFYSYPFFQRMRFTFDVGLMPRLTNDFSAPLLPMSARFGLGLDYLLTSLEALKREHSTIAWTTLQLHHYSNGQSDSFFIDNPIVRNNYTGGDFSTNYFRGMLNLAVNSDRGNTITTSLGYQHELDLGGPLVLSPQLKGYYGIQRLLFGLQWTQKPQLFTTTYKHKGTAGDEDEVTIQKRRQIMIRTEFEYILDDLSLWTATNKQRWGAHAYFTYMPSVANEVGLMAHAFYGRDYLNIRFDDVVFIGEIGVYTKFNRR